MDAAHMDAAQLQDQLRARAFLHDDPEKAYLAGVRDAVAVLTSDTAEADGEQAETA